MLVMLTRSDIERKISYTFDYLTFLAIHLSEIFGPQLSRVKIKEVLDSKHHLK